MSIIKSQISVLHRTLLRSIALAMVDLLSFHLLTKHDSSDSFMTKLNSSHSLTYIPFDFLKAMELI